METNSDNQQKIEQSANEIVDNSIDNRIVELSEKSNENTSKSVIHENACATELIYQDLEPGRKPADTEIVNNSNESEAIEKIVHPQDIVELKTNGSSENSKNSNLAAIKIQKALSTVITSTENRIDEQVIEKESSELAGTTKNPELYEKNWNDKSITIIEDITIVASKENITQENVEISEKINEESQKEICLIDNAALANEHSNVKNTVTQKTALKPIAKDSVSNTESTFLSEATVANYLNNSGLSFLQSQYGTDDSDNEDDSDDEDVSDDDSVVEISNQKPKEKEYRNKIIINSSDSDDSDIEYLSTEQQQKMIDLDELIDEEDDEQQNNKHKGPMRVKGELLLEDLPPIQDLKITVPETECVELGKIHSIVDQLVLVDSIPGTVPLDLDTVLFMDKGKTVLGEIFDVLGQIKSPMYCVRFNSNKEIKEKGIEIGQTVFVAPRTEHTQFIILDNLMRIRGSDASWENDIEPSDKHREFSDDEEEINYRRSLRNKDRPNDNNSVTKRTRTASTSSSMYNGDVEQNVESEFENNQQRNQRNYGDNNQRFSRNRRGGYQPSQQFQRGGGSRDRQNYYQNTSRFNYDNSGGSWHANYNGYNNNYGNDYYQQQQRQSQSQQRYSSQPFPPPQQNQQSSIIAQSNLYPNPYAISSPYIPPNVMQQPLFPPQQTYSSRAEQPSLPNYPPQ